MLPVAGVALLLDLSCHADDVGGRSQLEQQRGQCRSLCYALALKTYSTATLIERTPDNVLAVGWLGDFVGVFCEQESCIYARQDELCAGAELAADKLACGMGSCRCSVSLVSKGL